MTDKKKRQSRRYKNKYRNLRQNTAAQQDIRIKETVFSENSDTGFQEKRKPVRAVKKTKQTGERSTKDKRKTADKAEHSFKRVSGRRSEKYRPAHSEKENIFEKDYLAGFSDMVHIGLFYDQESGEGDDNPAAEALREGQQKTADGYRFIKRHEKKRKQKKHKRAETAEKKEIKRETRFQYQRFMEEHFEMQEKTLKKQLQKRMQKQRIKREYAKATRAGRTAKNTKDAARRSANTATSVAKKLQEMIGKRAAVMISAGMAGVLLLMVMTSVSSCGAMFFGGMSTVLAGSYMSRPTEIDAADLVLSERERDLQAQIDQIETDYPDYDEYRYNLAPIGHDPFTLISYLSAVHTEFTASEVQGEIE